MADLPNIPNLPGGSKKENPLAKKDLDILDPEAKAKSNQKKSLADRVNDIKEKAEKLAKVGKKIMNIISTLGPWGCLIVVIIIVVIGVIGYLTTIPGLTMKKIKGFFQNAVDTVQGWFTTDSDARINQSDVVELANYLEELDYDLVGYGFIEPVDFLHDFPTYSEVMNDGYEYYEKREGDDGYRYYNEAGEAYAGMDGYNTPYYYNSLGVLIDNSTGQMSATLNGENYIDQYGLVRSTTDIASSGKGKIVAFNSTTIGSENGDVWIDSESVDTTLLRTYLLSDYRIYAIRNNEEKLLKQMWASIKRTFGGYDFAWSKGLMKFYYTEEPGIAKSEYSESLLKSFGNTLTFGLVDEWGNNICVEGTTLWIKAGNYNYQRSFSIDGWSDRYGMSLEFLLSLHLATMQPDLVYSMVQNFDTEVQVYLYSSGDDTEMDSGYVDWMDSSATTDDIIEWEDIKQTLEEDPKIDFNDWLANSGYWTSGLSGFSISKHDALYLLKNLPLESPVACTGAGQYSVIEASTYETKSFGPFDISENALGYYGITESVDPDVYEIFDQYTNYEFNTEDGDNLEFTAKHVTQEVGIEDDWENKDLVLFKDEAEDLDYDASTAEITTGNKTFETSILDEESSVFTETNYTYVYNKYKIERVTKTREWDTTVDGTEVGVEWVTYKYLIYSVGTKTSKYDLVDGSTTSEEDTDPEWIDTILVEYIVRDKSMDELEEVGLVDEDGHIKEDSRCSNRDSDEGKACKVCRDYVRDVVKALALIKDKNYSTYTPYIARVLGSWFRDTYFIIPETEDYAISDYKYSKYESTRSEAEIKMINNSFGKNSELVKVDEDYLAATDEYWTKYIMKDDNPEEYQLYYLNPNGTTSDTKMEDWLEANGYNSQEEAEEAGHVFVKKAEVQSVSDLNKSNMDKIIWSAYEFDSDGAATGWIKIDVEDFADSDEIQEVYDDLHVSYTEDELPNEANGGFYYNLLSTNSMTQVEDAQRSETNSTIKYLFKYRKFYIYDGTEKTALAIHDDKNAVLEWAIDYISNHGGEENWAHELGQYGRSALRQTYSDVSSLVDIEEVAEQWLSWQLDMYYTGITNGCPSSDIVIDDDLTVTLTIDGETVTRTGDPRNPNLIGTTNITKNSLNAFTILENTKTLAAEYEYRDFKELIVELDYFDKEDLSEKVDSVFTWILPDRSPLGWPVRPYDKQNMDYGALIESAATYNYIEDSGYNTETGEFETEDSSEEEESTVTTTDSIRYFQGYEDGELVTSPVTGKVVEYGTHSRINLYTEEYETVGYIKIQVLSSELFKTSNVSNNSGDTEGLSNSDVKDGLNLFYEEYEDVCTDYTIMIDGIDVDLNLTDADGNRGSYTQNEVYALYNSEEQEKREAEEQAKDDAPFVVLIGMDGTDASGSNIFDTPPSMSSNPESEVTYIATDDSEGIYIKEGKYIGKTIASDVPEDNGDEDTANKAENQEYDGPAEYIRIMIKDKDYSIIDYVEDFFDIPEITNSSVSIVGILSGGVPEELEDVTDASSDAEKVRAIMTYFINQGFTAEAAAGIVGNLAIENSHLNHKSGISGGTSYVGLAQWSTSRWQTVLAWMQGQGYNADSFAGQVRAIYESGDAAHLTGMGGNWATLASLTDPKKAAEYFAVYHEGCVGTAGNDGPTEWYSVGSKYPVGTHYQGLLDRKKAAENALIIYQGDNSQSLYEGTSY